MKKFLKSDAIQWLIEGLHNYPYMMFAIMMVGTVIGALSALLIGIPVALGL